MVESHIDRDSKRAIALSDNKGDRFWDSWMERSDRIFGQ